MHKYDVTVIGGSLAGSYLALLLAQKNYRVLLIEKDHLPRRKACGEGMASVAKSYLEKIGVWDSLPEDSYSPYYGYEIEFDFSARPRSTCSLKRPVRKDAPEGYRVSRQILDDKVYQRTFFTRGITRKEASVRSIMKNKDSWEVECGGESFTSEQLVIAAGAASLPLLKKSFSVTEHIRNSSPRFGMVFWLEGSWKHGMPESVLARSCEDYQILLTAINNRLLNISLLINKQGREMRDQDRQGFLNESLEFAASYGFTPGEILEQRGASRIESREVRANVPGLYLIGDSAEVFDPIGGLGMVHAFESAELAFESLHLALRKTLRPELASALYRMRRKAFAIRVRLLTSMSYGLNVKRSLLVRSMVRYLPSFSSFVFSFLRKSLLRSARSKKPYQFFPVPECENVIQ